uniref:Uncharacterized protein n=1 Tax=Lepeophtheirus salmonis TaxID=72036 RepID=A0A0K2TYZ7_LEPSM
MKINPLVSRAGVTKLIFTAGLINERMTISGHIGHISILSRNL